MCYRLLVFPLVIKQRQNIAKQNNIAPELQRYQADLQAAVANKADHVEGKRVDYLVFILKRILHCKFWVSFQFSVSRMGCTISATGTESTCSSPSK